LPELCRTGFCTEPDGDPEVHESTQMMCAVTCAELLLRPASGISIHTEQRSYSGASAPVKEVPSGAVRDWYDYQSSDHLPDVSRQFHLSAAFFCSSPCLRHPRMARARMPPFELCLPTPFSSWLHPLLMPISNRSCWPTRMLQEKRRLDKRRGWLLCSSRVE
jgi:hypothetical protein